MELRGFGRPVSVDVGHVCFVTLIAGFCIWYFFDAWTASSNIQNMMLIAPVSALVALLYVVIVFQSVTVGPVDPEAKTHAPMTRQTALRIFGSMALLGLYVATMNFVGFDVATFAYVLAELLLLGERRVWLLVVLPAVFVAIAITAFSVVLSNPIPLLFGNFS